MPKSRRVKYRHGITTTGSNKRTACNRKKLKWVKMQIYRVPLNPEQAVLACCEAVDRGQVISSPPFQCGGSQCGAGDQNDQLS